MTTLGTARNHDELVEIFVARREELGLSNQAIEDLCGLAPGIVDKYLGPARTKPIGRFMFDVFSEVFALSWQPFVDPDKLKRMEGRWEQRNGSYVVRPRPRVSKLAVRKAKPLVLKEIGGIGGSVTAYFRTAREASKISLKGNAARKRKLTRQRRSEIAAQAAKARWTKVRKPAEIAP